MGAYAVAEQRQVLIGRTKRGWSPGNKSPSYSAMSAEQRHAFRLGYANGYKASAKRITSLETQLHQCRLQLAVRSQS